MRAVSKSLREEIREIVDEAQRAGRSITATLIWGLVSHDVPDSRVTAELSVMVKARQLDKVPAAGVGGKVCFVPGPQPVKSRGREQRGFFMGAMMHKRLLGARAAARKWLREGKVAA